MPIMENMMVDAPNVGFSEQKIAEDRITDIGITIIGALQLIPDALGKEKRASHFFSRQCNR